MPLPRSVDGRVHATDYIKLLRKHLALIVVLFAATTLTVAVWTFTQTPVYEGVATVLIEPEPPKVLNIQDVNAIAPGADYYQTQYQMMRSRAVAARVIEALKLRQRGRWLAGSRDAPGAMLGAIAIEPRRNTRLVLVKATDPDPALAAELANAFATQYVKYNLDIKMRGAQDALAWLTEQMSDLKAKVQESSTALQNYRIKSGILGLTEQRQITAQKIMDFNKAYLEAQAQRLTIEAKVAQLTQVAAKDRSSAESMFTVAENKLVEKFKGELAELESQKTKLLRVYRDKHPEVVKIDAQIQHLTDRIGAEIQGMLRSLQ